MRGLNGIIAQRGDQGREGSCSTLSPSFPSSLSPFLVEKFLLLLLLLWRLLLQMGKREGGWKREGRRQGSRPRPPPLPSLLLLLPPVLPRPSYTSSVLLRTRLRLPVIIDSCDWEGKSSFAFVEFTRSRGLSPPTPEKPE